MSDDPVINATIVALACVLSVTAALVIYVWGQACRAADRSESHRTGKTSRFTRRVPAVLRVGRRSSIAAYLHDEKTASTGTPHVGTHQSNDDSASE